MGLKDVLTTMRLIEKEPARAAPAPASSARAAQPGTRPAPTLAEILESVPPARLDEKKLPKPDANVADNAPTFAEIYRAAGVIDPMHGFGAFKVLEILSSEHFEGLDPKARAAALAGFLQMNPNGPVSVKDVIEDAVRRDQALDGYEEFLRRKLDSRSQQADQANAELQAEIDAVIRKNKEKMEANRRGLDVEQQRFTDWQARKRIEERRLADAIAPFVEKNPITLGGGTAKLKSEG